ncbi:GNAT family N-acetyltransferase [Modestobacter sp. NPDC049651]|uniref:GNAT family N-acetyltransferase n=1 Tax=unclassified Modestobacter TaxID=2643866 RepID=UPI0033C7450C
MTAPTTDLRVVDDPDRDVFVLLVDGRPQGYACYRVAGRLVVFTHTEVDPAQRGRGVANELARQALEQVRASGRRVAPVCPFIAAYLRRHPEYADLVRPRTPTPYS